MISQIILCLTKLKRYEFNKENITFTEISEVVCTIGVFIHPYGQIELDLMLCPVPLIDPISYFPTGKSTDKSGPWYYFLGVHFWAVLRFPGKDPLPFELTFMPIGQDWNDCRIAASKVSDRAVQNEICGITSWVDKRVENRCYEPWRNEARLWYEDELLVVNYNWFSRILGTDGPFWKKVDTLVKWDAKNRRVLDVPEYRFWKNFDRCVPACASDDPTYYYSGEFSCDGKDPGWYSSISVTGELFGMIVTYNSPWQKVAPPYSMFGEAVDEFILTNVVQFAIDTVVGYVTGKLAGAAVRVVSKIAQRTGRKLVVDVELIEEISELLSPLRIEVAFDLCPCKYPTRANSLGECVEPNPNDPPKFDIPGWEIEEHDPEELMQLWLVWNRSEMYEHWTSYFKRYLGYENQIMSQRCLNQAPSYWAESQSYPPCVYAGNLKAPDIATRSGTDLYTLSVGHVIRWGANAEDRISVSYPDMVRPDGKSVGGVDWAKLFARSYSFYKFDNLDWVWLPVGETPEPWDEPDNDPDTPDRPKPVDPDQPDRPPGDCIEFYLEMGVTITGVGKFTLTRTECGGSYSHPGLFDQAVVALTKLGFPLSLGPISVKSNGTRCDCGDGGTDIDFEI